MITYKYKTVILAKCMIVILVYKTDFLNIIFIVNLLHIAALCTIYIENIIAIISYFYVDTLYF